MKNQWGAFVCTCHGKLAVQQERLGQPAPLTYVTDDPESGAIAFAAQAKSGGVDHVVASCCMGAEGVRSALASVHVHAPVHEVDLKHRCFLPHPDLDESHAKARRMLNGAMAAATEPQQIPEHHLSIGKRVVLVVDDRAALPLAAKLEGQTRLTVLVLSTPEKFGRADEHRLMWGRLAAVQGRLGELKLQIVEASADGKNTETVRQLTSDQLVWTARAPLPVKRRTGVHIVTSFTPDDVERVASDVADLSGDFLKPQSVLYDTNICAGGAANNQACGRCIPACPYSVVSRDAENPLRIRVDHLACEGCGACVAACPTGALQYSDPGALDVANTIAGMLSAIPSADAKPPLVVFHCSERGKRAIEAADDAPQSYTAQALPIEVPCLRYTSPANILAAFRIGAAGVALMGCAECPHGERELLQRNLAATRTILDAFGLGGDRLQLITVPPAETAPALAALDTMAAQLAPSPIRFPGKHFHAAEPRDAMAEAVEAFMTQLGKDPGPVPVTPDQPFAMADVRAEGCTLCRSCANVCPTHAFRFDETNQALSFRHISCIDCGLCKKVCPESVITLTKTLQLNHAALEDVVRVKDVMINCAKCEKPFINQKALVAVEAKLAKVPSLTGVFSGERKALLRMCPDCRAIAAMGSVSRGWQP